MADATYVGTLWFALGAGVATFFAPCAYPLLPGYVGYYVQSVDADGAATTRGALARGVAAAVGALAVFAALIGVVYAFGRVAVAHVELVDPLVGVVLLGLGVATVLHRAPTFHVALPARRRSVLGFGVFGGAYAVAAAGCVLPVLGAVVLQALRFSPAGAVGVVATYAVGVCVLLLVVTVLTAVVADAGLDLGLCGHFDRVTEVAGVVMVAAGAWQLYRSVVLFHLL